MEHPWLLSSRYLECNAFQITLLGQAMRPINAFLWDTFQTPSKNRWKPSYETADVSAQIRKT